MRLLPIMISAILCLNMPLAQAQILDDMLGSVTDSISDLTDEILPGISNIRVGVGPEYSPDYEGADKHVVSIAPLISLRYRDIVQVDNNRIRVTILGSDTFISSESFKAGPSLGLNFGRDEKDSSNLTGLGDVGTSIELGAFVSYQVGPTRARLRVRQDVASGHSGMKIIGDFRVLLHKTDKMAIVTTVSGTWVDNNYMDAFYSITAAQALASGLPEFDASSTFKDINISVATNYQFTDRWSFVVTGGYRKLLGDAKDNPLVSLRGDADQIFGGVFAVFSW